MKKARKLPKPRPKKPGPIGPVDPGRLVDAWNREHKTGIAVDVTMDDGTVIRTRTRSAASVLGGHTPVVWLESVAGVFRGDGCYHLARVAPAPDESGSLGSKKGVA